MDLSENKIIIKKKKKNILPNNICSCVPLLGVFKQTTEKFGPVDVLINNAGMQTKTMDAYDKIVAVNMVSIPTIFFFF